LEGGKITLDESLKLFEEGTALTAFCTDALKTAEQTIITLTEREDA
jgi:exodeoxyribonuclease VII small subunit